MALDKVESAGHMVLQLREANTLIMPSFICFKLNIHELLLIHERFSMLGLGIGHQAAATPDSVRFLYFRCARVEYSRTKSCWGVRG